MPQQLMSNPMAGMALDFGKASFAKNLSWVMSALSSLKYYFHVDNRYVISKLKVLVMPFMHANWKRERADHATMQMQAGADETLLSSVFGSSLYKPPSGDLNAPDLYIPTMSFLTLTLLLGYALGIGHQFHPEVLVITASRTLILLFFEVLGLKAGLYLIAVGPSSAAAAAGAPVTPPAPILDIVSYASYKYIHCILMVLVGLLLGSWCFYASILLFGSLAALFMMRTMKRVCTPSSGAGLGPVPGGDTHTHHAAFNGVGGQFGHGKHRRNYFLLVVGGLQILIAWLLVRTANYAF